MFRRCLGLGLLLPGLMGLLLGTSGCISAPNPWGDAPAPRVVVTVPPLATFVKNVGGKHVAVRCLCTGTGPHGYSPGATDTLQLRDAQLFLAVGLKLDDKFADKMAAQSQNARLDYIKLGDKLPENLKLKADKHEAHDKDDKDEKHDKDHDAHHDHEHGDIDPHVWLGIDQAKAMVGQVRDALIKVDAAHEKDYRENAANYNETLDKVLADGKKKLEGIANKKIISFHESLQYFSGSFGLTVVDVFEEAPGADPSSADLQKLRHEVEKKDGPRVIAIEPQYDSTKYRDKLGDKVFWVIVDPMETADEKSLKDERWYEKQMRANIENLAEKLK